MTWLDSKSAPQRMKIVRWTPEEPRFAETSGFYNVSVLRMSEDILVVVDDLGFDGLEVDDDVDKLLKAFHKSQVKELHIFLRTLTT